MVRWLTRAGPARPSAFETEYGDDDDELPARSEARSEAAADRRDAERRSP